MFIFSQLRISSVPDPGADGSVVEENRSVASDKHWLPLLVDDVIVNPADKRTIWTTGTRCVYMIWRKSPVKHRELTEASNSDSPDGGGNFAKTAIASIAPRFRK